MKTKFLRRDFIKNLIIGSSAILVPGFIRNGIAGSKDHAPLLVNSANETLKTIHSLRTIHGDFSDKEIPQQQIDQILQASIQAPNSSAMQTYSIIVIKDKDRMKKICGYQGAALLLYCVDYNRLLASAKTLGHSYHPNDIQHFITGSTNTILALQTAVIAAKALGIDSLTTNGVHRGKMQRVWDELDLPETHCYPLIALVLGYAEKEPAYHKGRLDGAGVFHQEKYHLPDNDEMQEIIKKYDDEELHLGLNDNWKKEHKHYLDWLFTKWLGGRSKPLTKETQAYKMLKRSGFIDLHQDLEKS